MGNPKLIILSEHLRGQSFELTNASYSIGRGENADICIPEATISTIHCQVVQLEDESYLVKDAGSTNGTRINGVRVDEQKMINSDILQIGEVEILYDAEDSSISKGLSTQTNINLEDTAGGLNTPEMENLNPFQTGSSKTAENPMIKMTFIIVTVVLVLVVVGFGVVLALKIWSK